MAAGLLSLLGSAGKGLMDQVAPKQKAVKIEELTARNPGAKRIKMTWGPMKIKGANVRINIDWKVSAKL